MLDDFGLQAALAWFLDRQEEVSGLAVKLECRLLQERLPDEVETAAFRIVQEAVANVIRHSQANTVSVGVVQDAERVCLTVRDNGTGFDANLAKERASSGAAWDCSG